MNRIRIDGGSYSFCLPDGGWGCLMPSSINTSEGAVQLPGEPVLALVGTRYQGRLYMAGQGHQSGSCWLWDGVWRIVSTTHGVSPCAFGHRSLIVATAGDRLLQVSLDNRESREWIGPVGSQGIRYVDTENLAVTGDETYRDGELFEWTRRGDVTVGQGHHGGAILNGRVLDPGDRRFIRFERDGDRLAVAMVDQPGNAAVLIWLTVAEITSLPPVEIPEIPPQDPPITPDPQPEPTVSIPNRLDVVQRVSDAHPHLIQQNTPATIRELYWRVGYALYQADRKFGFLSKSAGENGHDIDGVRTSVDAFAYKGSDEVADVFKGAGDGPGTGGIQWGTDERRPSNQWVKPVPFPEPQQPEEPEEPQRPDEPNVPPSGDVLHAILSELRKLNRHIGATR